MYRNFFNGVSTRSMAVGYPEALNLYWDCEAMSLSAVWKNGFMDAARHWTGRGEGRQNPLGDGVTKIDTASPVRPKLADTEAWPAGSEGSPEYRFLGYSLDKQGRPTFRYRIDGLTVEDKPEAVISDDGSRQFHRTFVIKGDKEASVLLAKGKLNADTNGWLHVDDRYWIKVDEGAVKQLPFGDQSELRASVSPTANSPAKITVSIRW